MGTKEAILSKALKLFAARGYEAVSVADIAKELGITKGALYRHYKNKRDVLDHIIMQMQKNDEERAKEYQMPKEVYEKMPQTYENSSVEAVYAFTGAQFAYWTEDEFASDFRKMLTLEQYHDRELGMLYQDYLSGGVICYLEDLFREMKEVKGQHEKKESPRQLALDLFAPFYLLLNLYDAAEDKEEVKRTFQAHLENFRLRLMDMLS